MLLKKVPLLDRKNVSDGDLKTRDNIPTVKRVLLGQGFNVRERAIDGNVAELGTN